MSDPRTATSVSRLSVGPATVEVFFRRALLLVAAAALATGALAGLARIGIALAWGPPHALEHGPLLVIGVFATVIGLERAVALRQPWGFSAPALAAACAVAMLSGLPAAPWLAVAATLAMVAINVAIVRLQAATHTWLMLLGSLTLAGGTTAWSMGRPVSEVILPWIAFFVLTIAAERLELSRLAPTPRWAHRLLVGFSVGLALSACTVVMAAGPSSRVLGVTMILIAAWQLRFDLARRTLRVPGLPRFSAVGVLAGAAWLGVGGACHAILDIPGAGLLYDAAVHTVMLGYVVSMVFAHAPIILPAVARFGVPYSKALYVPLVVLHGGIVVRVAGDLMSLAAWREAGAIANAIAFVVFPMALVISRRLAVIRQRRDGQPTKQRQPR